MLFKIKMSECWSGLDYLSKLDVQPEVNKEKNKKLKVVSVFLMKSLNYVQIE